MLKVAPESRDVARALLEVPLLMPITARGAVDAAPAVPNAAPDLPNAAPVVPNTAPESADTAPAVPIAATDYP